MTSLPRLGLLLLAFGGVGCLSPPTYLEETVDCVTNADCTWMGTAATCAEAGFCTPNLIDAGEDGGGTEDAGEADGGEADGGRSDAGNIDAGTPDAGLSDGGPEDGGDGGWVCPAPCIPPYVEIIEPAGDTAVSNPLVLTIKVSPGTLPVDEVHCNLPPPGTAWVSATEQGQSYFCTLPLDDFSVGTDFGVAATAVDMMGNSTTEIRWFTRRD